MGIPKGSNFVKNHFYSNYSLNNVSRRFATSGISSKNPSAKTEGKKSVYGQAETGKSRALDAKLKESVSTHDLKSSQAQNSNLGKPYKPAVPIFFYKATKRATDSINHRLFYINALFLIFLYDVTTALIDF